MIGETIMGYRIEEKLGRGGMGTVFKARDSEGHAVAVKVLADDLADETAAQRRFAQECSVLRGLVHPRIVRALSDLVTHEKRAFYAMELVQGEDLARVLARRGALPVHEALRMTADVLEGLAFAHDRGVLHRDVKPQNVFLEADGRAKLGDFGIAYVAGATRLTQTGASIGTPEYMAPEQAEGLQPDERTDIYAVGVLLYEALSGQPPFEAAQALAVLRMHCERPPSPLPHHVPEIVSALVHRALAKKPVDRFEDAEAMRIAVLAALESESVRDLTKRDLNAASLAKAETAELWAGSRRDLVTLATNGAPLHGQISASAGNAMASTRETRPKSMRKRVATIASLVVVASLGGGAWLVSRTHGSPPSSPVRPPNWVTVELRSGDRFEGELLVLDMETRVLVTRLASGEVRTESLSKVARYDKQTPR